MNMVVEKQHSAIRIPGDQGVWVFVVADMCMFALFFSSYLFERGKNLELFNTSQRALDFNIGAINTLILLASSWFVVLAIKAIQRNLLPYAPYFLGLAIGCGALFIANKVVEYSAKLDAGITMMTNDFYMFYYIITAIHMGHVVVGTVVLSVLWTKCRRRQYSAENMFGLESGATYWHMVDLLWIMIFPLIYLLR